MNQIRIPTFICVVCILNPCHVLDVPYIEGRITGQILEFNCSTGQKPLGQTVEIVANDRSQFTMAHFNTSCIRKHIECTPNECACTSNWFQWKTPIQNPSIILKVQCLMRFPDNKRETVKATIAFNGSYFWDYSAYQTFTSQDIYIESTTKAVSDTNTDSDIPYISIVSSSTAIISIALICMIIICWCQCFKKRRNTESIPIGQTATALQERATIRQNRRRDTGGYLSSFSLEMSVRERNTDHESL